MAKHLQWFDIQANNTHIHLAVHVTMMRELKLSSMLMKERKRGSFSKSTGWERVGALPVTGIICKAVDMKRQ